MDKKMVKNCEGDDKFDAFAAVVIIGTIVTGVIYWLYNMPS